MSLPILLNVPLDEQGFNVFAQSNDDLHLRFIEAINERTGLQLQRYLLNPIPQADVKGWLQREQQTHNDMNAVFGIAGSDLTDVNWQDKDQRDSWIQLHFSEMQQVAQELGIG